jgi:hypothetical protein
MVVVPGRLRLLVIGGPIAETPRSTFVTALQSVIFTTCPLGLAELSEPPRSDQVIVGWVANERHRHSADWPTVHAAIADTHHKLLLEQT